VHRWCGVGTLSNLNICNILKKKEKVNVFLNEMAKILFDFYSKTSNFL